MHPLLTRNRLGLYLLAWVPLTATSAYVLATRGTLGWLPATVLAVAVFLFYAFLCLSAWYPCRATPLGRVSFLRLLLTHLSAAVLISFVWTQAGAALAYAILSPEKFEAIRTQFRPQLNSIFTIGVLLYLLSVAFHYVLIAMEDSRHAEAQAVEARVLARDAELKALKAQVNPHFLFNSLNTVAVLVREGNKATATRVIEQLSDVLRLILGRTEENEVRLDEELHLVRLYLAVEQARFSDRLVPRFSIAPEAAGAAVPSFAIQHVVEYALRDGIARRTESGRVTVSARRDGDTLEVMVEDDGVGIDAGAVAPAGHGIAHTRDRLRNLYGDRATLEIEPSPARGTIARLRIPFRELPRNREPDAAR